VCAVEGKLRFDEITRPTISPVKIRVVKIVTLFLISICSSVS
jgi:hypothetical protein